MKVFIRSYVYHKNDPEESLHEGRTLIEQFALKIQRFIHRKTTVGMIKEKCILLELDMDKHSYITIKDDLIPELAASKLRINALQEQ